MNTVKLIAWLLFASITELTLPISETGVYLGRAFNSFGTKLFWVMVYFNQYEYYMYNN